jgi:hypothetical protein
VTTPVAGHPFTVPFDKPDQIECETCGLPEGNARHRGAFVVVIEVHANTYALATSEAENAIELIELGDHGDDVWTQTDWPRKPAE